MTNALTKDYILSIFNNHRPVNVPIVQVIDYITTENTPLHVLSDGKYFIYGVQIEASALVANGIYCLDNYERIAIDGYVFVLINKCTLVASPMQKIGDPLYIDTDVVPETPPANIPKTIAEVPSDAKLVDATLTKGFAEDFANCVYNHNPVMRVESVHQHEFGERYKGGPCTYGSTFLTLFDGIQTMEAMFMDPTDIKLDTIIEILEYSAYTLWKGNRYDVPPILMIKKYIVLKAEPKEEVTKHVKTDLPLVCDSTTSTLDLPKEPTPSKPVITNIADVVPYRSRLTICVRVLSRAILADGTHSVMVFDATASIRITFTKRAFFDKLVPGQSYYITGIRLILNRYRVQSLSMGNTAWIEPCAPEDYVQTIFDFTPLDRLNSGDEVDVIGVVIGISEHTGSTGSYKNGHTTIRRTITLVDDTGYSVIVMLWGQRAIDLDVSIHDIIAFSRVKCNEIFDVYVLGTVDTSDTVVNPDCNQATHLQNWFNGRDPNTCWVPAFPGITAYVTNKTCLNK
ncbi:hypothetical protein BC937DRAFT_86829 [Endogone sp. FLAS-F59071]|nr:hypothetical protein BC937DRAFT_86829 [Endogone sp. FLAS-F59071]|eukprot:RUS22793.1 hypothetical protein BC937DRAFT_86829 [Endogone sp. FLAS-F59071]